MCGLVGIAERSVAVTPNDKNGRFLFDAGARIAHRGPDDEQAFFWRNVGFLFRRLSIVDLAGGRQPFTNEDQSIVMMVNGEIYNHEYLRTTLHDHEFQSRSDCEVLLHLYESRGLDFLADVNGMFAFALLDTRKERLIVGRDRLGIKPFFYHLDQERFVFASEIKGVLAHPAVSPALDWHWILEYRRTSTFPCRELPLGTGFSEVTHLDAGTMLEIDLKDMSATQHRYWDPYQRAAMLRRDERPATEYIKDYRELLTDSVQLRLMADVECGLFLSGGIDSVAIASLVAQYGAGLQTFSILSQSTLSNDDAEMSHRAAQQLGLENHQVYCDWRQTAFSPEEWRRLVWYCEHPWTLADQAYKFMLHTYAKRARPNLKVILLGQGSDEFNGGYSAAENDSWEEFERSLDALERDDLRNRIPGGAPYSLLRINGAPLIKLDFIAEQAKWDVSEYAWDTYRNSSLAHLQKYALWHEDRTASGNSIENRVPFLDHRLVELTLSVPPKLFRELFWDKRILRESLQDIVPEQFVKRAKGPFFLGEDERYTNRMMYNVLAANHGELVEQAIAGFSNSNAPINVDVFRAGLDQIPADPEYANTDFFLFLVNAGILSDLATRPQHVKTDEKPSLLCREEITNWEQWRVEHAPQFTQRAEIEPDSIVSFPEDVYFARRSGGNCEGLIIVNGQVEFVLEENLVNWMKFLESVDGDKSVGTILKDIGVNEHEIRKHIEEAIEYSVLRIDDAID